MGSHIAFGSGQYEPATTDGRRLIAHELTHVVQRGQATDIARRDTDITKLSQRSEKDRQSLQIDTDATDIKYRDLFKLTGRLNHAENVDVEYLIDVPAIDGLADDKKKNLYKGLAAYAQSVFDLVPGKDNKASSKKLNLVHTAKLDLSNWGGPDASYRFAFFGKATKSGINGKIYIDAISVPSPPPDDQKTLKTLGETAAKHGFKRAEAIPDAVWNRFLVSLGMIPEALLSRIKDITFDYSPKVEGDEKEPAEFKYEVRNKVWVRSIVFYRKSHDMDIPAFARLFAHEIGHAIDHAPSEAPKGADLHESKDFKKAVEKDGGKAITDYGKKSASELFAECFSLFIHQPETLKLLRPNIFAFFETYQASAPKEETKPKQ